MNIAYALFDRKSGLYLQRRNSLEEKAIWVRDLNVQCLSEDREWFEGMIETFISDGEIIEIEWRMK